MIFSRSKREYIQIVLAGTDPNVDKKPLTARNHWIDRTLTFSRIPLFGQSTSRPQKISHDPRVSFGGLSRKKSRMDPNELIDSIVDAIDYAEIAMDVQGLIKARRLLNNDLRQAIDLYVQDEVAKALRETPIRARHDLVRAASR
jgi:hypothetical protein